NTTSQSQLTVYFSDTRLKRRAPPPGVPTDIYSPEGQAASSRPVHVSSPPRTHTCTRAMHHSVHENVHAVDLSPATATTANPLLPRNASLPHTVESYTSTPL
ncbi:unnamed protein product, partial [Ixodes persulcatus]